MRTLISYMNSTFNGVVTGDPEGDKTNFMVWTTEEFMDAGSECALESMQTVDTILLGRRTYEDLSREDKWPSVQDWPGVKDLHLRLGERINSAHKVVVTTEHPTEALRWGAFAAPRPLTGDVERQVAALKESDGGDILVIGSPTLVRSLTRAGLIDEYQILVRPVVVDVGERMFDGLEGRRHFDLVDVRPLRDGTMFVKYRPAEEPANQP